MGLFHQPEAARAVHQPEAARAEEPHTQQPVLDISRATLRYTQEADQTMSPDIWGCDYLTLALDTSPTHASLPYADSLTRN